MFYSHHDLIGVVFLFLLLFTEAWLEQWRRSEEEPGRERRLRELKLKKI